MEVTSKARRRTPKEIETFRINSLAVLRFLPEQQLYTFTKSQRLWKRDKTLSTKYRLYDGPDALITNKLLELGRLKTFL